MTPGLVVRQCERRRQRRELAGVRKGAEHAFVRWASRINAFTSRFPGFPGSDLQPPDDIHPDEWVTVFRFRTLEQLESWLSSSERAELLDEAEALLVGPVREQVFVEPVQADKPVTVVMTQHVPLERADEFAAAHDQVPAQLTTFPGFLPSELVPPVDGVTDDHVIVFALDSREHLDRWLGSDERQAWLQRIADQRESDHERDRRFRRLVPAADSPPVASGSRASRCRSHCSPPRPC